MVDKQTKKNENNFNQTRQREWKRSSKHMRSRYIIQQNENGDKSGHITALRNLIPMLEGTYSQYEHIDKLPYIYSAVECTRTKEGERKMKQYNGLVQLEVNRLAGPSEMEYVKRQAALLPQTFAAFCGSSGRSVKIWVRFALPDDRGLPEKKKRKRNYFMLMPTGWR